MKHVAATNIFPPLNWSDQLLRWLELSNSAAFTAVRDERHAWLLAILSEAALALPSRTRRGIPRSRPRLRQPRASSDPRSAGLADELNLEKTVEPFDTSFGPEATFLVSTKRRLGK